MAIITPYADPSAHGKVTPGLMFKRRGPRVVFGAAPRPRDKNSPAQQLQRDKIRQAVIKYRVLNFEELIFLRRRGSMLSKNPYQLYTSSQLKGNDWSQTKGHQLQTINNMVIFDRQQDDTNDMRFSLKSSVSQALIDSAVLWNRLDSETAGVITSDIGPNLIWTGTPSHPPVKFDDGAFTSSNANYLRPSDSGDFLTPIINKHMFGFWFKPSFSVINGIPQDSNFHSIMDWVGVTGPSGSNWYDVFFHPTAGFRIRFRVDGVSQAYDITSSDLTFDAGDVVYLAWIYDREGIEGSADKIKVVFGNTETITEIFTSAVQAGVMIASALSCTFIIDRGPGSNLTGALDNIKIEGAASNALFQEKINNRNNVAYDAELGYVFDNENIFSPGDSVDTVPELHLTIESFGVLDWAVPFYWALAITWSNESITERTTLIRLPKIIINSSEAIVLYLSTDMSNYFDENLFRLGATDNV